MDEVEDGCAHCSPRHGDPNVKSWGVFVASDRDGDGQPTHLYVAPSDGAHVAESDAEWLRGILREHDARRVVALRAEAVNQAETPAAEPCGACGCAKAWHRRGRCAGSDATLSCPCRGWVKATCQDCGRAVTPPLIAVYANADVVEAYVGPGCWRKRMDALAAAAFGGDTCRPFPVTLPGLEGGTGA